MDESAPHGDGPGATLSNSNLHLLQDQDTSPPPYSSREIHSLQENMSDTDWNSETQAGVANGVRSSPSPNIPNGKPASPYVKESTPVQTVSSKDPKAAAAAANDMRNVVRRKLTGYVGFANLPNQWHRKSVRKGFNFNVMVVGK